MDAREDYRGKPGAWKDGDVVMDANGTIAQRFDVDDLTGWSVLGWEDHLYPDDALAAPLRRLVPADDAGPVRQEAEAGG